MKKQYFWLNGLAVLMGILLVLSPRAYADDATQIFNTVHANLDRVSAQLGIEEPPLDKDAVLDDTEYQATKADLIEQPLIMMDQIDEFISTV